MKDLTAHSIGKHILQMALPIAAGMLFQTLYVLIDLYFVAHLGDAAIAGVGAGIDYLRWYLPGLALQFAVVATGSALRGTGIVQPTMVVQVLTVILNAILAPVLIAGGVRGILSASPERGWRARCPSRQASCSSAFTSIGWSITWRSTRRSGVGILAPGDVSCASACRPAESSR